MKKLYRKGTVHPSMPSITGQLSFLPAAILTLTVALSPHDREILAYLLCFSDNHFSPHRKSNSSQRNHLPEKKSSDHPPMFSCSCFRCYTSYWVRWDESPNRKLIHEIIDSFEEWLVQGKGAGKGRKERKRRVVAGAGELKRGELGRMASSGESGSVKGSRSGGDDEEEEVREEVCEEGTEKGSVRKFVSLLGERIWNVWN